MPEIKRRVPQKYRKHLTRNAIHEIEDQMMGYPVDVRFVKGVVRVRIPALTDSYYYRGIRFWHCYNDRLWHAPGNSTATITAMKKWIEKKGRTS